MPSIIYKKKKYSGNVQINYNYCPIGVVVPLVSDTVPSGFVLCDGRELPKSLYSELYEVIGNLPFAQSTREGYFKVPDLRDKFVQGANENLGEELEAGLPNITGNFAGDTTNSTTFEGAFSKTSDSNVRGLAEASNYHTGRINFDASDSNDIYGNSDTVQPPSICFNYIIRALNTTGVLADDVEVNDNIVTTANVFSAQKVTEEIEAVDSKNDYSTTEKVVGKWIDGKPIYKKSLNIGNFNFVGNRQNDISHNINNLEKAIKTEYYFDYAGYSYTYWGGIQNIRSNAIICSFYTDNSLNVTNLVITIEYTKTTDSAEV